MSTVSTPDNWQREDFAAWLRTFQRDDRIAVAYSAFKCPLVQWQKSRGVKVYIRQEYAHAIDIDDVQYKLPPWAAAFVQQIDLALMREVSAGECLDILERLQP